MKTINSEVVIATQQEMINAGLAPKCCLNPDDEELIVWRFDNLGHGKKRWSPFIALQKAQTEDSTHRFLEYFIVDRKSFNGQMLNYYPFARLLGIISGVEVSEITK